MRLAVFVLLALVAAGCGARGARPTTRIDVLAVNPTVGRAEFHLRCTPAGGDVPDPARACAAIAALPSLVTRPRPFVCIGGTSSWWDLTLSGRLHGRPFHSHVSTCWTPQMRLIGRLGIARELDAHMLARRSGRVLAGTERTFAAGALRPGDEIRCAIRGRRLETGVPIAFEQQASTGYGGSGIRSSSLAVTRHRDGSVTASCR